MLNSLTKNSDGSFTQILDSSVTTCRTFLNKNNPYTGDQILAILPFRKLITRSLQMSIYLALIAERLPVIPRDCALQKAQPRETFPNQSHTVWRFRDSSRQRPIIWDVFVSLLWLACAVQTTKVAWIEQSRYGGSNDQRSPWRRG